MLKAAYSRWGRRLPGTASRIHPSTPLARRGPNETELAFPGADRDLLPNSGHISFMVHPALQVTASRTDSAQPLLGHGTGGNMDKSGRPIVIGTAVLLFVTRGARPSVQLRRLAGQRPLLPDRPGEQEHGQRADHPHQVQTGTLHDISFGLNWFLNPSMKFVWNHELDFRQVAGNTGKGLVQDLGMRCTVGY